MKKVVDYLQELGLTEIEAKVYQGLFETGPTTVKDLAEHIKLKRITTHFNVENLIEKGLITQTTVGSRRQIVAEPPDKLDYLIDEKENQLHSLRNDFENIVQTLSTTSSQQAGEHIQIEYYEGKNAVQSVYKEILKAKKIYAFVNFNKIPIVFPENPSLFQKALEADSEREIWDIFEVTSETKALAKKIEKRHHYCFFPPNVTLSDFDFMIFDQSVAMIYLHIDKPYAIVSHSKAMATGLRAIHSIVWRVLSGKSY